MTGGGVWASSKPFILILPRPTLRDDSTEWRASPWVVALSLGEDDQVLRQRRLSSATTAGGELANVVEEDRPLQVVELRGVHGDLGEEGVRHQDRGLVAMARVGVAQQGGDVDLKGTGETIERGEGRHGLAVLDLRDVGSGYSHAGCELPLREVAHVAQVANGGGDLEAALLSYWGGD
jgi:hypothetical protein